MTRDQATLRQDVVSSDPKDAASPYGYIFAFRPDGTHARVVFADDSMRDVPLSALNAANAVPSPAMTESRDSTTRSVPAWAAEPANFMAGDPACTACRGTGSLMRTEYCGAGQRNAYVSCFHCGGYALTVRVQRPELAHRLAR
jgi:hypothetical protein